MLNALVNALVREDEAIAAAPGQGAQLNMAVNLKEAESSGLSSLSGDTTRHKVDVKGFLLLALEACRNWVLISTSLYWFSISINGWALDRSSG